MNIVITGATKGIGKAMAMKFLENGHHVIVNSSQQKNIDAFYDEVKNLGFENKCDAVITDMANEKSIANFTNFVLKRFNTIDVLINNAGAFVPGNTIDSNNLQKQLDINLLSAYNCSNNLIPNMVKNKKGIIVNICSIASLKAYPNAGNYTVSKFALLGYTKSLRLELMPYNIGVIAVMPGATLTDSWAGTDLPAERFIPAEDIAQIVYDSCMLSSRSVVEEIIIRPKMGDI
jgi:short-subunit dehydrogenase